MPSTSTFKYFPHIPSDLKAELLLQYFPLGSFKVELEGLHSRNAYNDILRIGLGRKDVDYGKPVISLTRRSIYHSLPEYLFHKPDRFARLMNDKEGFTNELKRQEDEKENALTFFAPIDLMLLMLSADSSGKCREYVEENKVLIDIITDEMPEQQKNNPFIRKSLPFLPFCKSIRGDKTLISLMLRKVLTDESISITLKQQPTVNHDPCPRYNDSLGAELGNGFLGNVYDETVTTFYIHYWDSDRCDDTFLGFISQMDEYRRFVQDYFMSVEQMLVFDITNDTDELILGRKDEENTCTYLAHNTNI